MQPKPRTRHIFPTNRNRKGPTRGQKQAQRSEKNAPFQSSRANAPKTPTGAQEGGSSGTLETFAKYMHLKYIPGHRTFKASRFRGRPAQRPVTCGKACPKRRTLSRKTFQYQPNEARWKL